MSSRAAVYTPPPPSQLTSSPGRSSQVRMKATRAAVATKVPKAPKLPREVRAAERPAKPVAKIARIAPKRVAKMVPKAPAAKPKAPAAKAKASVAPPPATAALKLLQGGRSSKPPVALDHDTVETKAPAAVEATEEMPVPELRAAETHRKLAAREKREKKLARARVKKKASGRKEIAGEKSGVRKKVQRSSAPKQKKSAPPPIPAAAKKKSAPPPVPAAAKKKNAPAPKSVAPPPPRASLADFAKKESAQSPAKVVHVPNRETTRQFALPQPEASPAAPVIPLSRVAPNDVAVPLVPTSPVPLTRQREAAPTSAAPIGHAAFAATAPARHDTQQVLLSAPAPFVGEDPNEDLLAPYTSSPLKALSKAITSFFD